MERCTLEIQDDLTMITAYIDAVKDSHIMVTLHNREADQYASATLTWAQAQLHMGTGRTFWPGIGHEDASTLRIYGFDSGQGPNDTPDRVLLLGDERWKTGNGAYLAVTVPVPALQEYLAGL